MATAPTIFTETGSPYGSMDDGSMTTSDRAEDMLRSMDESTKESTGMSLLHILTLGSIAASLGLFFSGKKQTAIFVGLWPPTFQALKAAIDKNKTR